MNIIIMPKSEFYEVIVKELIPIKPEFLKFKRVFKNFFHDCYISKNKEQVEMEFTLGKLRNGRIYLVGRCHWCRNLFLDYLLNTNKEKLKEVVLYLNDNFLAELIRKQLDAWYKKDFRMLEVNL